MSNLLEVKNLKKYFKTNRGLLHAVDDVSFTIPRGKTLGIVGESGCGKSTLGRTVIHLHEKTSGQILFDGKDISDVDKHQLKALREDMQMIFQDPFSSLNPRMSVSQLIAEPLLIYKKCSGKELEQTVMQLMDTVGLAQRLYNSYPHELDGGRRQRIGIARALALSPKFIVCDEPVSALDVSIQAQIINLLKEIQDELGISYLFVAHDLSMVEYISDRIGVMYLGHLVEEGTADEVYGSPLHPYTKALLSAIPVPDPDAAEKRKRIHLAGELPTPINPPPGCPFKGRCPIATEECGKARPELKDYNGHKAACIHI